MPLVGVLQDYNQIGVHHPDSQHYIGEILEDPINQQEPTFELNNDYFMFKQQQQFDNTDNNNFNEISCMKRLKNLLTNLKNDNNNNYVDEDPYLEQLL